MTTAEFQEIVWEYYRVHGRELPWRDNPTPYYVLVSELMLQQTQVDRVIPKFHEFIAKFPDAERLAVASLADVLVAWQGLGYNRRAKFLHEAAKAIAERGSFPETFDELVKLPGIGKNTAGAILAYAFEQPVAYVETNIRTVYLHHYFADRFDVTDTELLEIIERTLDREHPREWYSALMDYGTYLKKQGYGRNNASKHYKKQPPLKGSIREVRGRIIKELTVKTYSKEALAKAVHADERFEPALEQLVGEGLVRRVGRSYSL